MSLEFRIKELTEAITALIDTLEGRVPEDLPVSQGQPTYDEEESVPEPPKRVEMEAREEATGLSDKAISLIALAKEMGARYLIHDDQVVVDQRVLDEWTRREYGDKLGK